MESPRLRPADTAASAEWIRPRLSIRFGAVTRTVPGGFDAYARVFHPACSSEDLPIRWSDVAESNGRVMHARAQYGAISFPIPGTEKPSRRRGVGEPRLGDLGFAPFDALSSVLAEHTGGADHCWFGVWEGHGWLAGEQPTVRAALGEPPPAPDPVRGRGQLDLTTARLSLPCRNYFLFTGPLDAAASIGHWVTEDWFIRQSPNLLWPEDKTWLVASEIDFDSTLVGGTSALIQDIVDQDAVEAWIIGPDDSLAADGDHINS